MVCTLYYFNGAKEKLSDIANVHESRKRICFTFTNGSKLDVLRNCVMNYELFNSEAEARETCVQDVFNRFDDFVSRFVNQVEDSVNIQTRISIPMNELNSFKKILNTRQKSIRSNEVMELQSLKWR